MRTSELYVLRFLFLFTKKGNMKKICIIILNLIFPLITSVYNSLTAEPVYILDLPEIEVKDYKKCSDIFKADSILALAMLLNRECTTCSYEEKVYWASCTTYGVTKGMWTWQDFLFNKKQFWGFSDPRIKFNPKNRLHRQNLKAVKEAWENPKPVMFYASKIDTANNSLHYKQVKRNAIWRGKHYYALKLN